MSSTVLCFAWSSAPHGPVHSVVRRTAWSSAFHGPVRCIARSGAFGCVCSLSNSSLSANHQFKSEMKKVLIEHVALHLLFPSAVISSQQHTFPNIVQFVHLAHQTVETSTVSGASESDRTVKQPEVVTDPASLVAVQVYRPASSHVAFRISIMAVPSSE